jgi:uncharacterized protein
MANPQADELVRRIHYRPKNSLLRAILFPGAVALNREEILRRLKEHESLLRSRGVAHAALFGSRARDSQRPDSDTDILIELDPAAHITVFDYAGLKSEIATLFEGPVDVVNSRALKSRLRPQAAKDAVAAF